MHGFCFPCSNISGNVLTQIKKKNISDPLWCTATREEKGTLLWEGNPVMHICHVKSPLCVWGVGCLCVPVFVCACEYVCVCACTCLPSCYVCVVDRETEWGDTDYGRFHFLVGRVVCLGGGGQLQRWGLQSISPPQTHPPTPPVQRPLEERQRVFIQPSKSPFNSAKTWKTLRYYEQNCIFCWQYVMPALIPLQLPWFSRGFSPVSV